jgi:polyferredoxin
MILNKIQSVFITVIHSLLPLLFALIILFSNNIVVLAITSLIIFLIIMSNYLFCDCPITMIEDKYNENEFSSMIDKMANNTINLFGERYTKNDRALYTLELLWTSLLLVILKILVILLFISMKSNRYLKSLFK